MKKFCNLAKHNKFALLAALLLIITGGNALAAKPAPEITVKTLDNNSIHISDYKGDVVYVDFWATWCPPCRKSFPWMEEMHQRYKDLGFKVVAISLDNKRAVIDQFLKTMNTSFTIAHDPSGKSASAFNVKGMPSSYLIDRHGNIHLTHMGFNSKDKSKLEAEIKNLITQD
ncbi:MAG: TlpA disulfide reductase family protein [Gammaproteobacteria bacterium]|jgi:peroxiredoxin